MGAAASKAEEAQPQPEEAPPVQHVPGTSISEKEWHTTQAQTASPDSESSTEVHWREAKTASFPSAASPTLISLASGTANLAASPPTLTSFASESGPTFMSLASGTSPPLTSVASGSTDVPASSSDREVAFNPQSQSLHLASLSRKELRDHLAALFKAAEDNRRDEMARILGIEQGPEPKVEPSKVEVFDRVHPTRGTIPHARRLFGVEFEREDLSRQLLKGVAESKIDVVEKALKGRAVLSHLRKTGWKRARFKDLDDLDKLIKQLQNDKKRGLNKLHEEKSKLEEKIQNCEAEEERKQLSSKLENILVKIGTINRQIEQKEKEKNELLQKYTCDICKEFLDEAVKTKCGRYCWDCWQDWANNKYWTQDNRSNKPLCPNPIDCSCRGTCEPMESEREEINKLKVIKACEFRCGESGWESVDAKKESKKYCSLSEYKKHRDQCEKNPGREQRKEEAPPIVMMWPDLCLQDGEGQDALYKAAGMGKIKIVKMLIEAVTNADPKKRAELLGNRYSCRRWISLLRVSKGSLRSPLHVASRGGHLQVVGLLLKEQADLRAFTQSGSCPLSYAVQNKDWLMTHMLLVAGSDITTESLNDLKMTQNPTWFPKLLNAEEEKAPLVVAIRSNYRIEEVAKKLSNATKDEVNDSLLDGTTPLLAACSKPSEDEAKWLVQSLVEKNADVNKPGFINNSPLLAACEKGHFKLALYLLKAGSRWDEQDVEGRTPLSVLSWRSQDADDLVEYLQLCLKIFSIPEKEIKTFDQLENYAELGSGMFGVVVEAKYTGQAHAVKFPITTKNQKIRHLRRSTEDGQYSVSSNPDQKPGLSATTAPYPKRLARNTPHDEKVFTRPSSMPVDTLATASPFGSRSSEFYLDVKHEPSTASPQNRESNERRRIYSEFLHEALICTRVGYKKNVVPFCGANLSLDKEPFLVFEKMPGNSVHKHLFSYKNEPPLDEWCKKYHPWIYRALPQAASGLLALHMEGVVHRDVRAHNFLVGASYIEESKGGDASQETKNRADPDSRIRQKIYISDFGLSQMLKKEKKEGKASEEFKEDGTLTYPTPYPWMWTAPEILQHDIRFSKKSDVYMFGMFMYECFERKKSGPFLLEKPDPRLPESERKRNEGKEKQKLIERIIHGARPRFHVTPEPYKEIIEKCWEEKPEKRPDSKELQERLAALEKKWSDDEPA